MSLALEGKFLSARPPGKSQRDFQFLFPQSLFCGGEGRSLPALVSEFAKPNPIYMGLAQGIGYS